MNKCFSLAVYKALLVDIWPLLYTVSLHSFKAVFQSHNGVVLINKILGKTTDDTDPA